MSNIVNKVKDAVTGHKHEHEAGAGAHHAPGTHTTGTHNTTAGPHSSDMANKMDPRVDSDRDGSRTAGGTGAGMGHTTGGMGHTTGGGLTGTTGHTTGGGGLTGGTGYNTTAGPHSSDMANKMDPRVDSDRDASRTVGGTGAGMGATHAGHTTGHHGTDTAYGHTGHGVTGGTGGINTTAGPHSSDMANKMDPRVDSDRDGSRGLGGTGHTTGGGLTGTSHTTGGGLTGTHAGHTTGHTTGGGLTGGTHAHGAHNTTGESLTGGPGPAPNTAGPHKSDMMNKMDPRVDSDLDGSKTMGGDKTFSSGTGNM